MIIDTIFWQKMGGSILGNKVDICGVNTSELPVLSNEEMRELFRDLQQKGDIQARQTLVGGNLRLVLSVLQRFNNRGEPIDDLFQVGCIGLMKAIDNFDLSKNVKFSTYAVPLIIGEIKRFLRDDDAVKVSRSLKHKAYNINKAKEELTAKLNREPTINEIANKLEISKEEIVVALEAVQEPTSIYSPIYEKEGSSIELIDQLAASNEEYEKEINRMDLQELIQNLESRERLILKLRFFDELTQSEVAERIGVSQVQVSRLERKIIKKLGKSL
jgi:RNA polymerase sporulation-specific sigma factor